MPAIVLPLHLRRLAVAPLVVLLSGLAYQASVHSTFRVIHVPVVEDVRRAAGRVVRVPLPDLSTLRGAVPILSARLTNGQSRQRVRLLLGEVSRAEVDLPPGAVVDISIVLSEGSARAVTSAAGDHHDIRLVGDGDDWALDAADASNVFGAIGARVFVVPKDVAPQPPWPMTVWTLFALLGGCAVAVGSPVGPDRLRRPYHVTSSVVVIALTSAWLLPLVSDRRVLVGPMVFWPPVLFVLSPAVMAIATRLGRRLVAMADNGAQLWHRHSTSCERGGAMFGLVALSICQPLFEVIGASPEFFVARNTSATAAIVTVTTLALGLPLALFAIERLLRRVWSPAATAYFALVVAALVAVMVHPWMRRRGIADPWTMVGLAIGMGLIVSAAAWRVAAVRQFLSALAPAALIVPALFLADPGVADSLARSTSELRTPPIAQAPPIVLVVFDEFPLHSLLDAEGRIDAVRFPHFAALSREVTWFREATAVSSQTIWAVPAIVSGGYPIAPNAVPTLRYYPQNLFTLLADRYEMFVFGRFLQLCPEATCHREVEGPGDGPVELLADLGVVWLHIVVPAPMEDSLPPVIGDWLGFARVWNWRTVNGQRVRNSRRSEFHRFLATIDARPARLYFMHSLLPHMPFEFVPSEHRYNAPDYQTREENGTALFRRVEAAYADALHQRHLLQVGFVDALVGRLVARLRELGVYDQALVIVTADHGSSFREGMSRRGAGERNLADIVRVPLFVKVPGQRQGSTVDGIAESVDILPTIADVLEMRLPFPVDGRSLVGQPQTVRISRTFIERSLTRIGRRDVTNWQPSSEASLDRRIGRFGVGPYDALYAVPGTHSLLGRPIGEFGRRAGSLRVVLSSKPVFDDVDLDGDTLPIEVRGRVFGRITKPLAVVVNGRIAATTLSYVERGTSVFSTMIPEGALRAGRNDVAIYMLERSGSAITLSSTRE